MKKIYYFLLPLLVISSCAKEFEVEEPAAESATVELKAVIDNTETKTDYTISGSEAVFCWKGTEEIGRLAWGGYFTQTVYTSTMEASSGETELTFSGAEVTDDSGFAVYPKRGASNGAGLDWYSGDGYLDLGESIAYNPAAPLQNIVPMLGKLDADGKYVFKPVTGVIGVRLLHIPPTATKVTISSTTTKLSKGFRNTASGTFPDEMDAIYNGGLSLAASKSDAKNTKSYTFTAGSLDFDTEYTFYYPIPVGTITGGLTVTVYNGSTELFSKSSSKDQVVKLATITRLPLITLPTVSWTSMGTGKFIDTFVWSENSFGTAPVEVEFFKSSIDGCYRIANPYAAAANLNGVTPSGADDYFYFTLGEKGRVTYEWVNMGLPLSKNTAKTWAMIDGYSVAGYTNGYARSHVVSYDASGNIANLQLAPCYRTSDENKTGGPSTYDNEIGKDSSDGIIEIAFPGSYMIMPYTAFDKVVVSSNSGDSAGASGLFDNDLTNCWHTPWGSASTTFDAIYGEYAQVKLTDGISKFAFNYCTRNTSSQDGAPAMVVVGGSKNGVDWTILATFEYSTTEYSYMHSSSPNTWIGLPIVDASEYAFLRFGVAKNQKGNDLRVITSGEQWCNLAELKVFGITTGSPAPYVPVAGKVDLSTSNVTACCSSRYGGDNGGVAALTDGDPSTHWHSIYYDAYTTNDPTYGVYFDIDLGSDPIQKFQFKFKVRAANSNAAPTSIKYAVSNDGTSWTTDAAWVDATGLTQSSGGGLYITLSEIDAGAKYRYIRFGITDSTNTDTGSLTGDLNFTGYKKSVNLAELELYSLD